MSPFETPFTLCSGCNRHVRAESTQCPFCDSALHSEARSPSVERSKRMLAMTAALSGIAMAGQAQSATDATMDDHAFARTELSPRMLAQASPASGYGAAPIPHQMPEGPTVSSTTSNVTVTGAPPAAYLIAARRGASSWAHCITDARPAGTATAPATTTFSVSVNIPRGATQARTLQLQPPNPRAPGWNQLKSCFESGIRAMQWPAAPSNANVTVRFRLSYSLSSPQTPNTVVGW